MVRSPSHDACKQSWVRLFRERGNLRRLVIIPLNSFKGIEYFNVVAANVSACKWLRRESVNELDVCKCLLMWLEVAPLKGRGVALSDLSSKEAGFYRWVTEFTYFLKLVNQGLL